MLVAALIWVLTGAIAGWLAGKLMKGRDYGLGGNVILGMLGSMVGAWLLHLLGAAPPQDLLRQVITSSLGALLVLGIARRLRPVARQTRVTFGGGPVADLETQIRRLNEFERRVITRIVGGHKTRDPNAAFDEQQTFGQRVADRVASFGGSWTFIGLFLLFMLIWMLANTELGGHLDPFPFILLNLMLSCLAALQAPVIMMSQNRQAAKDRLDAKLDYEVNLRSETEITRLHEKIDLRDREIQELLDINRRQLTLLERVCHETD
jgi:uncharacterized membrane protein/uncharacterized membrane protein YeaQ/YmgE (transglycosylase-associated protein family)